MGWVSRTSLLFLFLHLSIAYFKREEMVVAVSSCLAIIGNRVSSEFHETRRLQKGRL